MRQRNPLVYLALALLTGSHLILAACADDGERTHRPNVLLIVVDDLRPLIGAYGADEVVTPNIDRLAAEGVAFTRAYSQWPACGPSRASFMSGLRPSTSGIHYSGEEVQSKIPGAVTLPRHFMDNGYRTYSIGKIYHGRDEDPGSWSESPWQAPSAEDNWQGYVSDATRELRTRLWREAIDGGDLDAKLYQFNGPPVEASDRPDAEYVDGETAMQAIETIRGGDGRPFFLAVGFVKPHLPFAAPKKYWDLYDQAALPEPEFPGRPAAGTAIPYLFRELGAYHGIPGDLRLSDGQVRELVHGYYASVSFIDAQVGRLLDELDRSGLRDSTIVMLIGDHGFNLGEQDLWGKHSLYELSLHSPLIVSAPRKTNGGTTSDALVELIDVYPTLSALAGLPEPPDVDGRSLVPLMTDPDAPWQAAALSQYRHFMEPYRDTIGYSLRSDRYRYTEWRESGSIVARELYDFSVIPREIANLAGDGEHAQAIADMSRQLEEILSAR